VIVQDRLRVGDARQHCLRTAAEPGEKVRLDKAGQDAHRRLQVRALDPYRAPGVISGHLDQVFSVPGVVLHDAVAAGDPLTQHPPQLGLGLAPVGAQGIDQHDLVVGHAGLGQLLQQRGQHPVVGHGPGQVAKDHGHPILRLHQVAQRPAADRCSQPLPDGPSLVGQSGHELRLDDRHRRIVRQVDPQAAPPIG